MTEDIPLESESVSFVYNWVMTGAQEKTKAFYDIWDIVLTKYLPKERPILFRSCNRLSKRNIQSFTGTIRAAEKFSNHRKGHLLICDTKEYLQFEKEHTITHERSFFPLCEFIKKGAENPKKYFSQRFYNQYKGEDEYIVRVSQNYIYDLKWNRDKY